jgi:hypothetical protein
LTRAGRPFFEATVGPSLRREGLNAGRARIAFERGTLTITGLEGGAIAIPAGLVERVRFGRAIGDPKLPETCVARIWRRGQRTPIVVGSVLHGEGSYSATMKPFAAAVAAGGGLKRVYVGRPAYVAFVLAPLGSLVFGYQAVSFGRFAMVTGSAWDWMMAGLLGICALAGLQAVYTLRSRPVTALDDIDRELSPF